MSIKLSQAMRLSSTPRVAFVGAGGKTNAITSLAREIPKPLVVSSTTHLGIWQTSFADNHIILGDPVDWRTIQESISTGITLITQKANGKRFQGLNISQINKVYEICENLQLALIMECDGSGQLPLKAPRDHEPPIPEFVDTVVVVAGLSGLGKILDDHSVYNPDSFSRLGNLPIGNEISCDALAKVLLDRKGGLKNIPIHAKRVLLLNQADTPRLQIQAGKIATILQEYFDNIITAEVGRGIVHMIDEPTTAIILAAGSSSRFGQTKQLLDYHGIPFIKAVTFSAINAGLSPIVVITGSDSEAVKEALHEFSSEINIVFNPDYQNGQSTSIRAGINFLNNQINRQSQDAKLDQIPKYPGSVIFLLADQPQVTPSVLRCLMEEHRHTLSPVIAPLIDGRRANPVLFDRITFPDLMKLEGDVGGRAIFSKYSPLYIEWNDKSLILDVDNPSDYERLILG